MRILVAEDNAVNQLFVTRTLEKAGHTAVLAENGEVALDLLQNGEFDVVLMDIQMPRLDGYQTTARIREREQDTGRHQPIVAMTAHAMKGDREKCLELGMDDYVSKPIDSRLLFEAIRRVIEPGSRPESAISVPRDEPASVDLNATEAAFASDPEFQRELARMFLEDCPNLMTSIRVAIDAREAADLKLSAHTLKGSAGVFKDQAAFDAALRMEHVGRDADWEHAESVWETLTQEMNRLSGLLAELE